MQAALAEEYIDEGKFYVSLLGNDRLRVCPFRAHLTEFRRPTEVLTIQSQMGRRRTASAGHPKRVCRAVLPNGADHRIVISSASPVYRALRIRGSAASISAHAGKARLSSWKPDPNPNLAADDEFAQSAM